MPLRSRASADLIHFNPPRWVLLNLLDPGFRTGLPWRMPTRSNSSLALAKENVAWSIIPEFLRSIGINSSQVQGTAVRLNETVGQFTVTVPREVLRSIADTSKPLTWLQAERCKRVLAMYLEKQGIADSGYCGLSTALARHS